MGQTLARLVVTCEAAAMLSDGSYEALVVDAEDRPDGSVELAITVLTGEHKGEVLTVIARGLHQDALDLLAMPATLTIEQGEPKVELDD